MRVHLTGGGLLLMRLPQLLRWGGLPGQVGLPRCCHHSLSCQAQASTCLMGAWLGLQACGLGSTLRRPRQGRLRGAKLQGRTWVLRSPGRRRGCRAACRWERLRLGLPLLHLHPQLHINCEGWTLVSGTASAFGGVMHPGRGSICILGRRCIRHMEHHSTVHPACRLMGHRWVT